MKNKQTLFQKRFRKDTNKKYLKKFRIYPYFLYCRLDKWLKRMSLNGWHVVHSTPLYFLFEKGEPLEKEYFTYGLSTQEGQYSLELRYPFLEKTYGIPKNKSKINSNPTKTYTTIEIDTRKIDIKSDTGYREMIKDRNRLYLFHFIKHFSVVFMVFIISILLFVICS